MNKLAVLLVVFPVFILQVGCSSDSDPDETPGFTGSFSSSSSSSSSSGGLFIEENADGFCHVDGAVVLTTSDGNTGDGYADPDNDQTNGLDYRVNVSAAGMYELNFRYATTSAVTGSVAVNELSQTQIDFPATGGATSWSNASVNVMLEAGDNDINVGTSDAGVPNIDSLNVVDDTVTAVSCSYDTVTQNAAACAALMGPASSTVDPNALMGYAGVDALGVTTTTGGGAVAPSTVTTYAELQTAITGDTAKVVQVSGTLTGSSMVDVGSNTTVVGENTAAILDGFGLKVDNGKNNVIIENLTFKNSYDDGITLEDGAHHVWVHNNLFTNIESGIYDGSLDIRRNSSYITVSWNKFTSTDKTMLVGSNDTEYETLNNKITYHHNWFNGTVQRTPRVRFADVHVFNNFYDNVTSYGLLSVQFADVLVEGNYFNMANSTRKTTSTGGVATSPHKGDIVACGNTIATGLVEETRGMAFDPALDYSYDMEDASTVQATVTDAGTGAGPH